MPYLLRMEKEVRDYYDRNTRRFLQLGQIGTTTNIHQALWGPGVEGLDEAMNYSNQLILDLLPRSATHILDLGCGVGSSVLYLAQRTAPEVEFTGVTISGLQASLANQYLQKSRVADRCKIMEASFLSLPASIPPDLAYSIEAFVHAGDVHRFFQEVQLKLKPGGKLILIDDFISSSIPNNRKASKLIKDFQSGWVLGSLLPITEVISLAENCGFFALSNSNLTPLHQLDRPRDQIIFQLVRFFRPIFHLSIYLRSLIGGSARWKGLRNGWIEYRMLVFEKTD